MNPLRKDQQQKVKEDPLAPTEIKQDNEPSKDRRGDANLSDHELRERLDNYSRIRDHRDHYFEVQQMKQKYEQELSRVEEKRNVARIHYGQGVRAGLPHTPIDNLEAIHKYQDQKLRDDVARDAKNYYHENNSLSKSFQDNKPNPSKPKQAFTKAKAKGIDRDR